MNKIYLECISARSKKCYELELINNSVNMSYGKINGKQKNLIKSFDSEPTALTFYNRKLKTKLKKYSVANKKYEQLKIFY